MNRITRNLWTLTAIAGLVFGVATAPAATIAHWTFDGGTVGNTISSDTDVEASIAVTPFSDGTATYANGPTGLDTAASFDGDVGLKSDPRSGTLTGLSALTVEAYIYLDLESGAVGTSGTMNIFRKSALWVGDGNDGDPEDGFSLVLSNGKPVMRLGRDSTGDAADRDMAAVIATSAINNREWVHVAGTWDGGNGNLKLFVDDVEVTTTAVEQGDTGNFFPTSLTGTLNDASNDGPAAIGALDRGGSSFGQYFIGEIDEVKISDIVIPEPASLALLGLGVTALLGLRRRR